MVNTLTHFIIILRHLNFLLVLEQFLKSMNRESRFLLPVREMRNCESKNDSVSILFHDSFDQIPAPIPPKCAKMAKEPESRFLGSRNRLRTTSIALLLQLLLQSVYPLPIRWSFEHESGWQFNRVKFIAQKIT